MAKNGLTVDQMIKYLSKFPPHYKVHMYMPPHYTCYRPVTNRHKEWLVDKGTRRIYIPMARMYRLEVPIDRATMVRRIERRLYENVKRQGRRERRRNADFYELKLSDRVAKDDGHDSDTSSGNS